MTKDTTPDFVNNSFAEMENQFNATESTKQDLPLVEETAAEEASSEPSIENIQGLWDAPEEKKPERNNYDKRVSKLVHQLNQERERTALLEQERQLYADDLAAKQKAIEQKDMQLLEGYKLNKAQELAQYEKLYDQAIEEGDSASRLKISSKVRELNNELSRLDIVLDNLHTQKQDIPVQPTRGTQPQVNPLIQEFASRNPEIQTDQRMAMRAYEIDNKLAQSYRERGEEHLIGSVDYMRKLEAGYRGQFNRPSSTGQGTSGSKIRLSPEQEMMAEDIFGVNHATGKKRSPNEAHELYRQSLKSRR